MTAFDSTSPRLIDPYRHVALEDVGSTNAVCLDMARDGDGGDVWVTARRQTSGRGRRGRQWVSEAGNLYASLLLIDAAPAERLHSLPLAVALGVREAVLAVLPEGAARVEIKWPNDVLIGRRKVAGILLEGERLADGRQALVIGCGVNVAHAPDHPSYPVTSLHAEGASASDEELFAHLFRVMAQVLHLWDHGRNTAKVTDLWRKAACGIGGAITVNLTDRSLSGRFEGIDDEGRLMLDTGTGTTQHIAAGDVFFG